MSSSTTPVVLQLYNHCHGCTTPVGQLIARPLVISVRRLERPAACEGRVKHRFSTVQAPVPNVHWDELYCHQLSYIINHDLNICNLIFHYLHQVKLNTGVSKMIYALKDRWCLGQALVGADSSFSLQTLRLFMVTQTLQWRYAADWPETSQNVGHNTGSFHGCMVCFCFCTYT